MSRRKQAKPRALKPDDETKEPSDDEVRQAEMAMQLDPSAADDDPSLRGSPCSSAGSQLNGLA
ncbi:unnamed protein product, partial [Ixodes hexagonus]